MKIKKIGSLCKGAGQCRLFTELTEAGEIRRQWISDGRAMWPVSGLPLLRESNLSTLFDFSPKQTESIVTSEAEMPDRLSGILHDAREWEAPRQESFLRVRTNGAELMALTAGARVIWLDADELRPCWTNETRLVLRELPDGEIAVAALDGMFLCGIVFPVVLTPDTYRELIRLGVSEPKQETGTTEEEDAEEDGGDEVP